MKRTYGPAAGRHIVARLESASSLGRTRPRDREPAINDPGKALDVRGRAAGTFAFEPPSGGGAGAGTVAVGLRDVARRSGVSVSTASRALHGSGQVSAATQARVRAVARALGYRPNASARALRTARSEFIGLVVT